MKQKLIDRRREMLYMHHCQISLGVMMETLSKKYNVSPETIHSDFTRRDSWIPLIIGNPEGEAFIKRLIEELHQARGRGWRLLANTNLNENARVGALRTVIHCIGFEVELLQSLGKMPKVPERLQQEIVGVQRIILENVTEDERACLNRAAAILDKRLASADSKRESNNLH